MKYHIVSSISSNFLMPHIWVFYLFLEFVPIMELQLLIFWPKCVLSSVFFILGNVAFVMFEHVDVSHRLIISGFVAWQLSSFNVLSLCFSSFGCIVCTVFLNFINPPSLPPSLPGDVWLKCDSSHRSFLIFVLHKPSICKQ